MDARIATKSRKTNETDIRVSLNLDGEGEHQIATGIPFFDHMLAQIARHGHFDLEIKAKGDLEIDGFGHAYVPLDEALTRVVIDLSGRPYLVYKAEFKSPRIGDLQTELIEEFLKALVQEGRFNLHVENLYGRNQHHIAETIFKATARALYSATRVEHAQIPSTKGVL
jgi:imidazoleglycerol-phosphate dehydratase